MARVDKRLERRRRGGEQGYRLSTLRAVGGPAVRAWPVGHRSGRDFVQPIWTEVYQAKARYTR